MWLSPNCKLEQDLTFFSIMPVIENYDIIAEDQAFGSGG